MSGFAAEQGELLKLDAVSHGDNHFFPGPCDIAWDVAGAIVEWELRGRGARAILSASTTRRSGDAIAERLAPYLLAYAAFRLGWSRMAASAMQGEFDEALLERDYRRYRAQAQRLRQHPGHWQLAQSQSRELRAPAAGSEAYPTAAALRAVFWPVPRRRL